ncbi:unnamed protein product [Lactuca virosa]|uniref:Uncharacterized protein n=1 Tax=Lactuca virosa TaxID=75947 RepID=A0AAU9LKE4_9ASTR|nr:unnamed protein product [Lactuca virosa]
MCRNEFKFPRISQNLDNVLGALVDAPDMVRGQMNFKRLTLTNIKIDINRVPKKKTVVAALEAAGRS